MFIKLLITVLVLTSSAWARESLETFEEGLRVNESLIEFLNTHQCEIGLIPGCSKPMAIKDIQILKDSFRELVEWKKHTFENVIPQNDWIQGKKFRVYSGNHRVVLERKTLNVFLDESSRDELQRLNLATASYLVMYDHFIHLSHIFSKSKKLRLIITNDMGIEGKLFYETFSEVVKKAHWKRTETLIRFLKAAGALVTPENNTLEQYIASSFTGNAIREGNFIFKIQSFLFIKRALSESEFYDKIDLIGGRLSQFFGNTTGKVQLRDGKLKKLAGDPEAMKRLKGKLAPLDIMFEKTPFRLTDKFIPGYYGHVAIWLGTPEELMNMTVLYEGKTIPLLDHPDVLPYLENLSQGKLIVEALREPGVTMNTLEHFMDIDDLLILKPNEVKDPGEHLLRTFQQIGKPYDFNFDVETESSIVCSELIYRVFNEEEWPVELDLGRYTISPDHVAWKAMDTCYKPKVLYTGGTEVRTDLRATLTELLKSEGGIRYTPVGNCN